MTSPALTRTPTQTVQAFLDALRPATTSTRPSPRSTRRWRSPSTRSASASIGAGELRRVLADLVRGFPDLMISVSRVIATGDVVTALLKAEGTQAADYAGAINQEKHLDIDQAWRFVTGGGLITAGHRLLVPGAAVPAPGREAVRRDRDRLRPEENTDDRSKPASRAPPSRRPRS